MTWKPTPNEISKLQKQVDEELVKILTKIKDGESLAYMGITITKEQAEAELAKRSKKT